MPAPTTPTTPVVRRNPDESKVVVGVPKETSTPQRPVQHPPKENCPPRRTLPAGNHSPTSMTRPSFCGQHPAIAADMGQGSPMGVHVPTTGVSTFVGCRNEGTRKMIKKGGGPCSGGRGGGGFNLLCVLPWVRLLLLVVCGLGRVDGFDKLPDGDGTQKFLSTVTLRQVVYDWITAGGAQNTVVLKYGAIEEWDVSEVTNMRNIFYGGDNYASTFGIFNADLSKWDTSAVTNMVFGK